jgi:predicted glycosyl hydrolase (DUF1957 family)
VACYIRNEIHRITAMMQKMADGEMELAPIDVTSLGVRNYNGSPFKSRFLMWLTEKFGPAYMEKYEEVMA